VSLKKLCCIINYLACIKDSYVVFADLIFALFKYVLWISLMITINFVEISSQILNKPYATCVMII